MPQAFSFVVVVWGERYTRVFAEVCLPSLLAPGNLPGLRGLKESCFEIYTTPEDEARLAQTPAIKTIRRLLEVKFIRTDAVPDQSKYDRMNACHRAAMQNVQKTNRAAVILSPDCLFSANCLTRAEKILDAGAQAIAVPAVIGLWEEILPLAQAKVKGGVLNLPERELMGSVLPHLHPFQEKSFVDAPSFTQWPTTLLWKISGEGILARFFHLHPLVVRPKPGAPAPKVTVDYDYLGQACDWEKIHIVRDSDELGVFSLCPAADNRRRHTGQGLDVDLAAAALARHIEPLHEMYGSLNLRLHEAECRSPRWAEAETEAEKLIAKLLAALKKYLAEPAWAKQVDQKAKRARLRQKIRGLPGRLLGRKGD